jgi:hypothetical protein
MLLGSQLDANMQLLKLALLNGDALRGILHVRRFKKNLSIFVVKSFDAGAPAVD